VEDLLVTLSKKHSAACTILRVGHVYGPELPWSQNIFGLVENEEFRLPFDGQLASNAVWINNLTTGIAEVIMQQPALPVLNVTDAPQTTWRELFDMHSQASGNPTVPPLLTNDSDRRFREYKRWSETGMMARLGIETLRWIKHLPGSYLAAVPTFKALSQRASAVIGSADLDARLRAGNCKRAARAIQAEATPEIPPAFFSEPVPGPCLNYPANSPMDGLEDLRGWYNAMSGPVDTPAKGIYSETSVG
jgi:hypothetical protein